jgi:phospholipid-binding lipoprotein MlaA
MTPLPGLRRALIAAALVVSLGGCATGPNRDDPFEPWNRTMFEVNDVVDGHFFKPIAQAYVDWIPEIVRTGIGNVLGNIDDLFSAVAGLLSGRFDSAGNDLGRVITNTMFGFGGLIDVASDGNIPKGNLDFGIMLGSWGIPQGPYLFVPLWGPTTFRDGTGSLARIWLGPTGYIHDVGWRNSLYGVGAVEIRAEALPAEKMVEQAAIDRYTFIRRAYLQRREYQVTGKPAATKEEEE